MKKIFLICLLLGITTVAFSQQTNPAPDLTKQDYLQKSKKQKTAAWILIGGGGAFAITGIAMISSSAVDELASGIALGQDDKTFVTGTVFFITGAAAMLGSIPLFIASSRNKKKGMSVSFKHETVPLLQHGSFVNRSVPSLSLKISL